MKACEFALGLPSDSPQLLPKGAVPEVGMLDSMDACDEADENAMETSQQPSLGREDRSRTRDFARARFPPPGPCGQQQQKLQQHVYSPNLKATVPYPSTEPSTGEDHEAATQGGGTASASEIASTGEGVASAGADTSTEKDTAKASNFKERRNPIKNLQPEFLSAILESDDQLDYHTEALLGYYDADDDKRLMIVDLKDFLPTFYGQLGCDQPESLKLLDLFASSDLDRDGSLDSNEFKGFLRALLKQGQEAYELSQL